MAWVSRSFLFPDVRVVLLLKSTSHGSWKSTNYGAFMIIRRTSDAGWPSNTTTSCVSTLKFDIIEAWKRRKKKNHRKEAWKRRKKRRQLKLDRLKLVPHRLKPAPPAIAGPNTGYSPSTRVNSVLAMKPPMLSFSIVTKLSLARGCLYIWLPLPLPRIEMN
jgi:hypothetical protein